MSLDLALGIARSGLAAVQRGLAQNAQNVANADTPGYRRKLVTFEEQMDFGRRTGAVEASPTSASRRKPWVAAKRSSAMTSLPMPTSGRRISPSTKRPEGFSRRWITVR